MKSNTSHIETISSTRRVVITAKEAMEVLPSQPLAGNNDVPANQEIETDAGTDEESGWFLVVKGN
ncbi:hypothetical protein J2P12_06285 [Candidatus Bathyarchaeota archaeon]|nr:hypothetical protein [Candidatus Bathyarchaeota archaeon]